ncbi:MAG TPA: VWA domain-containing protein [Candidatus Limnocylindria bacterium]|nr:VWA domain-containing protein [Candidatus Limnocylindria bacterium]
MNFASPWWLLGLLSIPLLAWLRGRSGRESAFIYSSLTLVKGITELSRSRAGAFLVNLRWLALALLFIGLARPQVGGGQVPLKASGIDIAVAVDLSGSMAAEDFELHGERVNRLIMLKDVLKTFIDHRPSDRIGLVAFATEAFIAAPPTLDHDFLNRVLDRLELGVINGDQTAIGSGLSAAVNRLRELKSKSRIVVLMTDGQNNAGKIPPLTAAEAAQALGVKVYTIGIGTRGVAQVPVHDAFGRKFYVNQPVDIDEDTLTKIAEKTGGKYYRADTSDSMRRIYAEIDKLEKTEVETKRHAYYDELMSWFVVPALGLLALELLLGQTVWRKLP